MNSDNDSFENIDEEKLRELISQYKKLDPVPTEIDYKIKNMFKIKAGLLHSRIDKDEYLND